MEFYYDEVKFIGIGETGASALKYFCDVGNDILPERLLIFDKDDIADSWEKVSDYIADCEWLFVITDIEHLEVAETLVKGVEEQKNSLIFPSVTILTLCPSATNVRLADIPENFGTWIILPEDKIVETSLTRNELIYRAVNMTTSIIPIMKKRDNLIGMDFADVVGTIGNCGRACIGFGESLDAENNSLQAVKNALKSSLFIEDIRKAKKALLVFFGNYEFLLMLEMNEAANFLYDELRQSEDNYVLWQVDPDESAADGVAAFVLATDFIK